MAEPSFSYSSRLKEVALPSCRNKGRCNGVIWNQFLSWWWCRTCAQARQSIIQDWQLWGCSARFQTSMCPPSFLPSRALKCSSKCLGDGWIPTGSWLWIAGISTWELLRQDLVSPSQGSGIPIPCKWSLCVGGRPRIQISRHSGN